MTERHHRPALPGAGLFAALPSDDDPAARREAGDRCARLLVRGARESPDQAVAERIVKLAETEGLETLAELWSGAPAESLAGSLWRLYLLRTWVHANPVRAAQEYDAGRTHTPVHEVVAGVVDPPGPDEVKQLVDEVLRGISLSDYADTLFRAAAFARVAATGRAYLDPPKSGPAEQTQREADLSAARLVTLAQQLDQAGHLELAGRLT